MSLDPEIAELLPALNGGFPRVETMTAPQLRDVIRQRAERPLSPEPVGNVIDRTVPGPAGDIGIRIYWPATSSGPVPVIVFAHGGGFVFCDLDTHDELCRAMTNGVGAIVVSVDYRLAPESPWPAAVRGCLCRRGLGGTARRANSAAIRLACSSPVTARAATWPP